MYTRYRFPEFKSKNNLDFWSKNYEGLWPTQEKEDRVWFIIGTCSGMYHPDDSRIEIRTLINKESGNGNFEDVMEWFEFFCKRDNKDLVIGPIEDMKFRDHLINKRGFIEHGPGGAKKIFKH